MDVNFCVIRSCKKVKVIGRFCLRHYGDKIWLKIRCCLEEIYNQDNLESHLLQTLPDPVTLKDFCTFLNFLRIGYNQQDLKIIFQVFSGKNNCIVPRGLLISFILMPDTNWDLEDNLNLSSLSNLHNLPSLAAKLKPEPEPVKFSKSKSFDIRPLSPFSSYKSRISEKLSQNFPNFSAAWTKFSRNKSIGFFELSRMLAYLKVPYGEQTIKAFLNKNCGGLNMDELQFKALWFNRACLCKRSGCEFEAAGFGVCKKHERNLARKGEVLFVEIENLMENKKVAEIREKLQRLESVSVKLTKNLFSPYVQINEKDWEAVMIYINLQLEDWRDKSSKLLRPTRSLMSFSNIMMG